MPTVLNPKRTNFDLVSGRRVWFENINLEQTWGGWLEGVPEASDCADRLEELQSDAREAWDLDRVLVVYDAESTRLPEVGCRALLMSDATICDDGDISFLAVVWFQDEMRFPPSDETFRKLALIPWDRFAQIGST